MVRSSLVLFLQVKSSALWRLRSPSFKKNEAQHLTPPFSLFIHTLLPPRSCRALSRIYCDQ